MADYRGYFEGERGRLQDEHSGVVVARTAEEQRHREAMASITSQVAVYRTEVFAQVTVHEQALQAQLASEQQAIAALIEAEKSAVLAEKELFITYCNDRRLELTEAQRI